MLGMETGRIHGALTLHEKGTTHGFSRTRRMVPYLERMLMRLTVCIYGIMVRLNSPLCQPRQAQPRARIHCNARHRLDSRTCSSQTRRCLLLDLRPCTNILPIMLFLVCLTFIQGDQYRHMITTTEIRAPEASDGRFKLLGGTGAQPPRKPRLARDRHQNP